MGVQVKLCGLSTEETVEAACSLGAEYIGLNFFPGSPRAIDAAQARVLSGIAKGRTQIVGLLVDPSDDEISEVAGFVDILQLHGRETPERVLAIKERFEKKIMKAFAVATAEDLAAASAYGRIADLLLFDAKAPTSSTSSPDSQFGGHGNAFDWTLLRGYTSRVPWMLAGGLTPGNVSDAILKTGVSIVDVSSGIERTRGVKDIDLMNAFMANVKSVSS
jgi:phosphoribosylanthranilate isomerase